jgi:hypothetical protein
LNNTQVSPEVPATVSFVDPELQTAITYTTVELAYVRQLLAHRGGKCPSLVTDELEVLARLADLKMQAGRP